MDLAKIPPVSRRLDYVLQALEDITARLDTLVEHTDLLTKQQADAPGLKALMTMKDVSAALSLHERTVRNLVNTGELSCVKVGRQLRFTPRDVDAFIVKNRRDWGSSRWRGKGRRRYGNEQAYDDAYIERLSRPDPADKMPPLDDDFRDALAANGVNYQGMRALRLAGVRSLAKAKTYSFQELMSVKGIGWSYAEGIMRATGRRAPRQ